MAFPATHNINYYKGDTYEMLIKPRTSAGSEFIVTDTLYSVTFKLAPQRGGPAGETVYGSSSILSENSVLAQITPSVAAQLDSTKTYFYDIRITSLSDPNIVYTLLNGSVSIVEGVT
jgi:hypothetical protein